MTGEYIKKVLGTLFFSTNYFNKVRNSGLTIFAFHDVTDTPSDFVRENGLYVTPKCFSAQMKWIRNNYSLLNPRDLLDFSVQKLNKTALITFDDGWKGSFKNAIPIMHESNIPSLHFLNMSNIICKNPCIPALVNYLMLKNEDVKIFFSKLEINHPFYLDVTPTIMNSCLDSITSADYEAALLYQGEFASEEHLKEVESSSIVSFGNHLYEHYNAKKLSPNELEKQYHKNEEFLSVYKNYLPLFAFPHGQPDTCFSTSEIKNLRSFGAKKVFSCGSSVNKMTGNFVLDRVSLNNSYDSNNMLYYVASKESFKNLIGLINKNKKYLAI